MMVGRLSAAGALQWFRNQLCKADMATASLSSQEVDDILTDESGKAPAGCDGLFFLPYLSGERTPHADPDARGCFIGLTLAHTRAHLLRAIMEGVTYSMRDSLEIIEGLEVPVKQIRASGGGSRSPFWRQIQADVFGRKVVTINTEEGPAFGVALLAAVGAAAPLLTVQRSEDEGGTWQTLRGLDKAPCAFAEPLTVHDREAARGVALRYRACVEASFDDAQLVSDWRTAAVEAALSVSGWNLKCPLEPERDWLGARIVADPEWTQEEDAGTFRPIGRRLPVVVSMALGGADGSLVISVATEAEWEAAQRLRDYAGTLYLESPYGWARYVRILSRSWVETGAPDGARRRLTCSFLEVEAP